MPEARRAVSRRALLGGTAAFAVLPALPALTGCGRSDGGDGTRAAAPDPELAVLLGAITAEQDLIALYEAARGAHAVLAERIDPVLAHHREHLAVLRRHYVPGSGNLADESGTVPPPRSRPSETSASGRSSGGAGQALAALRRAEGQAAAARVAEVGKAGPGLAQLLASIGACEAGHAAVLARA